MGLRILIAEEEGSFRSHLSHALDGHDVIETASGAEALEALRGDSYPLFIASMQLGDVCGLSLMKEALSLNPGAVVVATIGRTDAEAARQVLRFGAHDFLVKPCEDILMDAVLRRAMERVKLMHENENLLKSLKRNVDALSFHNARLEQLANRDELTGLYNYRYFREAFETELSRCRRHKRIMSLLFADVDSFKQFNDRQGHLAGDALLATLGRLMMSMSRKSTIVARYGGEEFVLVAPETNRQGALLYAEKLRSAVESYPFEGREAQPGGRVTMSLGVATYPDHGTDVNSLIKYADDALYRAKENGRNQVCG